MPGKAPASETSSVKRIASLFVPAALVAWLGVAFWNSAKPLPPGIHFASQTARLSEADVDFAYEAGGLRGAVAPDLSAIDHAEHMIVIDRSPVDRELAQHLLARKRLRPNLKAVVVTDPANLLFGGTAPETLASLEQAGIIVARVRLEELRDSNPLYSALWRLTLAWWNDPFEETSTRVTLPAWSRMRNFKADERQLVVADDGSGGWTAVMAQSGAASSLTLRGSLARAMIGNELLVAAWSTDDDRLPGGPPTEGRGVGSIDARFLTEGAIAPALLDAIAAAGRGDLISFAVENLSDRRLITAALAAAGRGAHVNVLLARNPTPNRAAAGELLRKGGGRIDVRWYGARGAAPRSKLLIVRHGMDLWINVGTANFTRRNLGDLNLEANVELRLPARAAPARAAADYFAAIWASASPDAAFADVSVAAYWRFRLAEATGLSSF
jgi:PLD-like domain